MTIEKQINNYVSHETLTLPAKALGSSGIQRIIEKFCVNDQLVISKVTVFASSTENTVTVEGIASLLSISAMPVSAVFQATDTEIVLILTATLPSNWKFSQSFPSLANSFFDPLTLIDSRIILSSDNQTTPSALKVGLNYAGSISGSLSEPLSFLFSPPISIAGPIRIENGVPAMDLALSPPLKIVLGAWDFPPINCFLTNLPVPIAGSGENKWINYSFFKFSSQIIIDGNPIAILGSYSKITEELTIEAINQSVSLAKGLDSIFSLIDYTPSISWPASFDLLNDVYLNRISFSIALAPTTSLENFAFSIVWKASWALIPDKVTLDKICVAIWISDPFASKTRQYGGQIYGQFLLGSNSNAVFDIYARIPTSGTNQGWTFSGRIQSSAGLQIGGILTDFGSKFEVAFPDALQKFTLKDIILEFSTANTNVNSYFIVDFAMSTVPIEITFNASFAESAGCYTVNIDGQLLIEGNVFAVEFSKDGGGNRLIGGWKSLNEKGLTFADLARAFGFSPPEIPQGFDLALKSASFTYDFTSGSLDLKVDLTGFQSNDAALAWLKKTSFHIEITYAKSGGLAGKIQGEINFQGKGSGSISAELGKTTIFELEWKANDSTGIKPLELIRWFDPSFTPPDMPAVLDATITRFEGCYDTENKLGLIELETKEWVAELVLINGKACFGLGLKNPIDLVALPLIGDAASKLGGGKGLAITDLGLFVAQDKLGENAAKEIREMLKDGTAKPPEGGMDGPVELSAALLVGDKKTTLFPLEKKPQSDGGNPPVKTSAEHPPVIQAEPAAANEAKAGDFKWVDVQKTLGPVSLQRIGFAFKGSDVAAQIDASLVAGGLEIDLFGLELDTPLWPLEPHFAIAGLAISFQRGSLTLSGGMIGTLDPIDFTGELILGVKKFTLSALAGYAELENHPSLFVYAVLNASLGGDPAFFITGLAAGFGFNRSLLVPGIEGVAQFPLVTWATAAPESGGGGIGDRVKKALTELSSSGVVAPAVGRNWFAGGVRFTTYKLLDSFALVTLSIGDNLEVDLLGLSTLEMPPKIGDKPPPQALTRMRLALKASYTPASGLISIFGQLTPDSFVLSPDCHVTGGFAFCVWVDGEHAGDMVASIGGYHPKFKVPSHYPAVPRLGINWRVNDRIGVKGEAYLAVTSRGAMAGGNLVAVYEGGDIRAWYSLRLDFLVEFAPFHYDVSGAIDIGVWARISLTLTDIELNVHVGANFEVWGPPFSGIIHVDLEIISFQIEFGNAVRGEAQRLSWDAFVTSLLPVSDSAVLGLAAAPPCGLVKDLSAANEIVWAVDGDVFELTIASAVPLKNYVSAAAAPPLQKSWRNNKGWLVPTTADGDDLDLIFGVRPCGIEPSEPFVPSLAVEVLDGEGKDASRFFSAKGILAPVPTALWKTGDSATPFGDQESTGARKVGFTGVTLKPVVSAPNHAVTVPLVALDHDAPVRQSFSWSRSDVFHHTQLMAAARTGASSAKPSPLRRRLVKQPIPATQASNAMVSFLPSRVPALPPGRYVITVTQTIALPDKFSNRDDSKKTSQTLKRTVEVRGDRFRLAGNDIVSVYPPDLANGHYQGVLPHVVLRRPALPWLNSATSAGSSELPSMAILVFKADDIVLDAAQNTAPPIGKATVKRMQVLDLVRSGATINVAKVDTQNKGTLPLGTVSYPDFDRGDGQPVELNFGEAADESCMVLELPVGRFNEIAPTLEDLRYLAHVRRNDTASSEDSEQAEGCWAVVLANRLAIPDQSNIAVLVSLTGMEDYLPKKDGSGQIVKGARIGDATSLRLICYHSWRFFDDAGGYDFTALAEGLNNQGKDPSTLRLPDAHGASGMPEAALMSTIFADGFVVMKHRREDGTEADGLYRGPLAPYSVPRSIRLPVAGSAALLGTDTRSGLIDTSYAAAWQLGQLLALQSSAYSVALYRWKMLCQKNRRQRHEHERLHAGLQSGKLLGHLLERRLERLPPDHAPPPEVVDFLAKLRLLRGVPYAYLVPDERMLPVESLRAFQVNADWVEALLDGAMSIGRAGETAARRDEEHHAAVRKTLAHVVRGLRPNGPKTEATGARQDANPESAPALEPVSGFLLRSRIVSGWPRLIVKGYSGAEPGASELPVLRMERLSNDVLLCLFEGVAGNLIIQQPPEQLHSGIDASRQIKLRSLSGSDRGKVLTSQEAIAATFRNGDSVGCVLDIGKTAADIASKLPLPNGMTSAEFALQMIQPARRVAFVNKDTTSSTGGEVTP